MAPRLHPAPADRWRKSTADPGEEEAHALGVNTNLLRLVVSCVLRSLRRQHRRFRMIGWWLVIHTLRASLWQQHRYFC